MGATLDDFDSVLFYPVNDAVAVIYFPAPISAQITSERFWLPNSIIPVPVNVFYEIIYFLQRLPVLALPIQIVLPCIVVPRFLHTHTSISSRTVPPDCSMRSAALTRRAWFSSL